MGRTAREAAADAERVAEELALALQLAHELCTSFSQDKRNAQLSPSTEVSLTTGAEDQHLFVFSLLLDLDDDLDAEDYPIAKIEELQNALRARITESPVDEWDWIVTIGTKAGAALNDQS